MTEEKKTLAIDTLADALMREITRVRDEVIPPYILTGYHGSNSEPALLLMRTTMDRAIRALAEQDATACLQCFGEMKGFTL